MFKISTLKLFFLFICVYLQYFNTGYAQMDWAKRAGGSGADQAYSVATDTEGNSYITGYFGNDAEFYTASGVITLTSNGMQDIFVAKYNKDGNCIWAKGMGSKRQSDVANDIAVDRSGNVYIVGNFFDSVFFDPGNNAGKRTAQGTRADVFLAKYDKDGNYRWAISVGGDLGETGRSVDVDEVGNVYIAGLFNGPGDYDPGADTAILRLFGAKQDIFLAKYDSTGKYVWAISVGGPDIDYVDKISVDSIGNVYMAGYFEGASYFNPDSMTFALTSAGNHDIFLAKYDPYGKNKWAINMGSDKEDRACGVAVAPQGHVYISGFFRSDTINLDPKGISKEMHIPVGDADIFLAKYDSNGNYIWSKSMGGESTDNGISVTADRAGNVILLGNFYGPIDVDPGPDTAILYSVNAQNLSRSHFFLAKYDIDGNYIWAESMGGSSTSQPYNLALNNRGELFTTGTFTAIFNPDTKSGWLDDTDFLESKAGWDIYLVKFLCTDTSSSHLETTVCREFVFNGKIYTEEGDYIITLSGSSGCDSTVFLTLSFYELDPNITISNFALGVDRSYATYQWIKDGVDIPGATDSFYNIPEGGNGDYQVRVTNESGCEGISAVYKVENAPSHINNQNNLNGYVSIYPNPAESCFTVFSPIRVEVALSNIEGKVLLLAKSSSKINIEHLPAGIYLLRITDPDGRFIKAEKIVKP